MKKPKVALVYDRVNKWGGAERVLLALNELFPDAPLYTSVYDSQKALWARIFPRVYSSFLQKIPILKNHHELLGWLTPLAYESFSFDQYDLVISMTSEAAKGILTKPQTKHICLCLTPTRYLWSGYQDYLDHPPIKLGWIPFYRHLSQPFLKYAKIWDGVAAQRPDIYLAISSEVQKRIKNYYQRDSIVIYPPVDVNKFVNYKIEENSSMEKDYYLIVSRLVPYKKVDLAIKTFNELELPLIVVGTGSEETKLKFMSRKNIKFKGFVSEEELIKLYKGARGFIYPQEEDFGITAVEAQSAGVPIIAFKRGGIRDTVIEGETGIFFDNQTVESLSSAILKFERMTFSKNVLVKNADRFSKTRFKEQFKDLVEKYTSG